MNSEADIDLSPAADIPGQAPESVTRTPANWREALLALIASRIALIELEFKEAAKDGTRRAVLAAALVFCLIFMWALLLAGSIAGLARITAWPWYWIAIAFGVLHLVAAIRLAMAVRAPQSPVFPVTRAEFTKDREWIEKFHSPRKSDG